MRSKICSRNRRDSVQRKPRPFHEPSFLPRGFGLRQSSGAFRWPRHLRKRQRTGAVQGASAWFAPLPLLLAALFLSLAAGCATQKATPPPTTQEDGKPLPFIQEILAFETSDRTNPPPRGAILFVGSSSIRLWKTLAQDFPGHRVVNRGFGGSQIIDSVRYADRIVFPYKPKQIVMYAGGNDINAKKTPEQVFADYKAFVKKVHAELPRVQIAYISIAPNPARWAQVEQVRQANQMIADFTKTDRRLTYIDTFTRMLGPDGQPLPDIYVSDRLHMNAKGYELWKGIVGPVLLP
jgi:lysophospholipase L1-like esterase